MVDGAIGEVLVGVRGDRGGGFWTPDHGDGFDDHSARCTASGEKATSEMPGEVCRQPNLTQGGVRHPRE